MDPLRVDDYYVLLDMASDALDDVVPSVQVELDEYPALWCPWRCALWIKILGRNINFRVLERLKDLWKLPHGCEMIALEHGYVVVRFYSGRLSKDPAIAIALASVVSKDHQPLG
ncbi:hypothetical protein M9H77_07082 [Catharanthus roseus]|uniref:Uncharacterized protein n=1 Tax=Catharanthus roseus TaxID=4058 RepID=A0ACC0BTX7_CATRO|nr:hypothetical protein M9H77_07082 [Catharanthus roseus]